MKQDNTQDKQVSSHTPEIKRQMVEEAKIYSSATCEGLTINNPEKYKIFRDGQDSGYSISKADNEAMLKYVADKNNAKYCRFNNGFQLSNDNENWYDEYE